MTPTALAMRSGLSASTHTDTVVVPSITLKEDELKCRFTAASGEEVDQILH